MLKKLLRLCSMMLVIVMVINMLPMQSIAADFRASLTTDLTDLSVQENAKDARIVEEITSERTEYSKEFILENGLHMAAVYNDPVHYLEEGSWEEIDNTLKLEGLGTNRAYTNTAGVWDVRFPQQLNGNNAVTITKDGYTLSFGLSGELRSNGLVAQTYDLRAGADAVASSLSVTAASTATAQLQAVSATIERPSDQPAELTLDKLTSRLQYANVYANTNIVYDLKSNQVKESIVINQYSSTLYGYRYTLNTGDMIPVLGDDGHIDLYDANRENIVMTMPAPFLVDDANTYSFDVNVTLTQSGDQYILTYLLPRQWLASAERSWPVILDPIVTAGTTWSNLKDQTVTQKKNLSSTWGMLQAGYTNVDGISRFFIMYEHLPDLTSSDVIVGATIELLLWETFNDSHAVEVHKVNGTWEEDNLHWSNMPGTSDTIEDFAHVQNAGSYTWNITDIVRGWYSGENTGMMFKMSNAVENAQQVEWRQFVSSEFGTVRPNLTIVFRNNNGLESYWDYTTQEAGRSGTGYINNYTGNLVWVRHDMGFDGNRMPVSINHIYNANDSYAPNDDNNANDSSGNGFGLGYGWRTNYNQLVYQWSKNSNYYVWEDSDGTDHYFYRSEGNTYKDEDGLELTLTTDGSGTQKYKITDKYGNKSYFDTEGRLTKLENNQQTPSSIDITYISSGSRLISTITDGAGRRYVFTYTNGLLTRLSYMGSGTTEITYVTYDYWDSKLDTVIDKDRSTLILEYYDKNLLKMVWGADDYEVHYRYNATSDWQPSRVSRVLAYDGDLKGGALYIEYANNQTTFTDHNGNVRIMQFNNWGNTLSVQDDEGRAQYGQYANNDANNNNLNERAHQLRLSSKLQNTVGNLFGDSSFENGTTWSTAGSMACSVTTEAAYYGSKSLKASGTGTHIYGAAFTVPAGESYTFSAYVKSSANSTARLDLADTNGTGYSSETISGDTGWTRLETTYTNTSGSAATVTPILCASGTVYMDCIQLEKAVTASRYNLVDNGDFRNGTSGWLLTNLSGADGVVAGSAAASQLDSNVLQFDGVTNAIKHLYQQIHTSGSAGDTYVLAGWAKGDAVPLGDIGGQKRDFSLVCIFHNTDSSYTERSVTFSPDTDSAVSWQYAASAIVADKDYHTLYIDIRYDYNANRVWFDGIQLYKEEFGSSYTYDGNGNVISVTDLQKQTTTYEYSGNNLTKEILPSGVTLTYTYDDFHNVKTATTNKGLVYTFDYDTYGNNTQVSISNGSLTMSSSAAYTANGNLLASTTDAAGNVTEYGYNANTGLLQWVHYPEDGDDICTTYSYDSMYRLVEVWKYDSSDDLMYADYSYYDDLLSEIDTPTTTYSFARGDFDLVTEVWDGSRKLATYTYTDDRNFDLARLDYGNGHSIEYEYDDQGRVTKEIYKDTANEAGDTVTYQYDNYGGLAVVTDSETGITTKYYYDFTDRLMKQVESGAGYSHTVAYTYDSINNLTAMIETVNGVDHTTNYSYDEDNRIQSVSNGDAAKSYDYDDFGRVTEQKTKHNGSDVKTETLTYRNLDASTTTGQVASYAITAPGYQMNYTYTYDGNGNILSISDGTHTTSYVYDEMNQLLRENNQAAGYTWTWEYDEAGNILCRRQYAYTTGALGTATATQAYTYDCNVLIGYNGATLTNDVIGNRLSDGNWQYTWHHGRQLASITNGSTTWSYAYNADGLRTQKTNGSQTYTYVYNGGQLTQMVNGSDTLYFAYDVSGLPMTVTWNGTVYYYVTNLQGDVTAILNASGAVVTMYTYDAWGKLLTATGSMASTIGTLNPLRYRGYVYDLETGLYYVSSRYYDPEIGRWINADGELSDVGGDILGYNLFAYCFNNPVNMDDPTGNWPKWLSGALNVVGGALQVAAGAALGATVGWTGFGAVAAGFLIVNGTATAAQGVGQIVNHVTNSNVMREDNIVRTGVQEVGRAIGGDTGAKIAGGAYDVAVVAANLYAGKVGLQQAGKLPIKVNINNVVNNPLDEFVTIGPADGVIQQYCRTIPQSGYGKIYATQLGNGLYQIANGHHRVAALRALGYETIKIFLTK